MRERKRVLDSVLVLTLVAAFASVAGPWFVQAIEVDMAAPTMALLCYLTAYLVLAGVADRMRTPGDMRLATQVLQLSGILFLAVLWHLVGGVANPAFLLAFFLPVAASGVVLRGWQPYAAASISAVAVGAVTLAESPELRGYMIGASPQDAGSGALLAAGGGASSFVLLGAFTLMMMAGALVSETVASHLVARRAAEAPTAQDDELEELAQTILRATPAPTALVDTGTSKIVHASDSFLREMLLEPEDLLGRGLFQLLGFVEPERIRSLLESGGEARHSVYRVNREARIADIRIRLMSHGGRLYAYLEVHDLGDQFCRQSALDGVDEPVIVLGSDQTLRYANRAAERVLGGLHFGLEASTALARTGLPRGWWKAGPEEKWMEMYGRPYWVSSSTTWVPGELRFLTIIRMRYADPDAIEPAASMEVGS